MASAYDFSWGDWTLCHGRVTFVEDSSDENPDGRLGLVEEHSFEIEYFPVEEVTLLPEVRVSEDVLRSFFRLEVTPWQLCAKHQYPFAAASGTFTLTEADLHAFAANLGKSDIRIMDAWETMFLSSDHPTHVYCEESDLCGFSLLLAWEMIRDFFGWFDIEEDDPLIIAEIVDAYSAAKGLALDQLNLSDDLKGPLICRIEDYAKSFPINETQRRAYVKYLDELCEKGDSWAIKKKAYAYYGGNGVVPCRWDTSAQTLTRLWKLGNFAAANSLGYIYYSDRLGKPDYKKAFYYFSRAAEAGILEARYKLSDMYRKGHGIKADPKKAWSILQELYPEQLKAMQDQYYGCNYADIALRIGYCYEDGVGVEKDIHKAHEFYERARFAIEMRMLRGRHFGDDTVRVNVQRALSRVQEPDSINEIAIHDLPGWPGDGYGDLTVEKENKLRQSISRLFECDWFSDEFDPEDHEEHLDEALELAKEYDSEIIFNASHVWAKEHCKKPEEFINFANLFCYYFFCDACVANPYPFLAFLYNGIDWKNDRENAENASDVYWSIATAVLRKSGILKSYYYDEYEPLQDEQLLAEMKKQKDTKGQD